MTDNFQTNYYPNKELSADEEMVGFKGRVSMKQYMPGKPTKWGLKVWMLYDAHNSYACNLQVYTGKEGRGEHGLGFRVVMDLAEPYLDVYHHISLITSSQVSF